MFSTAYSSFFKNAEKSYNLLLHTKELVNYGSTVRPLSEQKKMILDKLNRKNQDNIDLLVTTSCSNSM